MASSDNISKSESLQIISVTKEGKDGEIVHGLELNEINLKKIMLHPEVKDNPVVIVSIAGASRKGKSFLLGFFLKYLESQDDNWLNEDDRIEGFEWRNGTDLITSGIHIWSKPFIRKNRHGKKIAVLLMDTQGVFDRRSTAQDCTSIFALSNLISSVQIYNLMHHLQEDDLQHLEFFAHFGKLAKENTFTEKSDVNKTRLVFLIRDWGCPDKYPYGKIGGEDYIENQLKMEPNEHKELQRIRQNLRNCFPNISGFLLPYPGKAVATKETFDGHLNDIDEDFVVYVKELVPCILSEESLVTKQINYMDVSGKLLMKYIEDLVEFLKNGEYPSTQTLFEVTAEFGRQTAVNEAFNFYKEEMKKSCDEQSEKDMDNHHKRIKKQAFEKIKTLLRVRVSANESKSLEQLDSQIEEEYNWYKEILRIKNKSILQVMSDRFTEKIPLNCIAAGASLLSASIIAIWKMGRR